MVATTVCRKDRWLEGAESWRVRQAVFLVMDDTVDGGAGGGEYGAVLILRAAVRLALSILWQ
jgi:hypothetical protein